MVTSNNFILVSILIFVLIHTTTGSIGRGSIIIENNGYSDIVVSIANRVEPNGQLLDRIRSAFTEASAFLYEATRHRAYFKEITILVPSTWPYDPSYEPVRQETPDKSDILIDFNEENQGDRPYTVMITPCGEPGYYTHFTPQFLLDNEVASQFGEYGRVLVHEWSHLRYGVYDEYPAENDGTHFYALGDGNIEATRCSSALTGSLRTVDDRPCELENGLPEPDCRFIDDQNLASSYGSIMYRSTLDHIHFYCDSDPSDERSYHNYEAPTMQNRFCERSVWEILREHEDFFNGTAEINLPREVDGTVPEFKIVQQNQTQMQTVLVLDTSGSMIGTRLQKLNQGCSTYISSIIGDGESLGIISFSTQGYLDREITVVSDATRQYLLDGLPTWATGGTSIGSGLRLGLEVLQTNNETSGGTIIVVSDGEENTSPTISDVWEELMSSGVTIHSIAITDAADSNMDALAQATGGLSFIYSENDNSNAINEAFRAIGDLNADSSERRYPLLSGAANIAAQKTEVYSVVIDNSLGRDTQFIFDHSEVQGLSIDIRSPSGRAYNDTSPECRYDSTYQVYTFDLSENSETGEWFFNVTNNHASRVQSVSATVVSKSSTPGEYPIVAQAFWGRRDLNLIVPNRDPDKQAIYAAVSKGSMPVLFANVNATIERPGNVPVPPVEVVLRDNGAGADLIANDGIYSAYFLEFTDNGRYGVTVSVNSNAATVISPIRIIGQGVFSGQVKTQSDLPTGDFQRLANGGSFELTNYEPTFRYPPGRIHDLNLVMVDRFSNVVTLEWTAVGAQLDLDTLGMYDLRFAQNFSDISVNFENQSQVTEDMVMSGTVLFNPKPPGQMETLTIILPNSTQFTYYFAIKGVDGSDSENGTSGPMSNIVSATLREIILPTDLPPNNGPDLGLILGLTFGILALVVIIVGASLFTVKQRNKRKHAPTIPPSSVHVNAAMDYPVDVYDDIPAVQEKQSQFDDDIYVNVQYESG